MREEQWLIIGIGIVLVAGFAVLAMGGLAIWNKFDKRWDLTEILQQDQTWKAVLVGCMLLGMSYLVGQLFGQGIRGIFVGERIEWLVNAGLTALFALLFSGFTLAVFVLIIMRRLPDGFKPSTVILTVLSWWSLCLVAGSLGGNLIRVVFPGY